MNNIVYSDTVGVDGTVYPTTGENIRNSNFLMTPKEIITVKATIKKGETIITNSSIVKGGKIDLYVNGKDLFLIKILNKNLNTLNTTSFLVRDMNINHFAIKIRDNINFDMNGEITLLVGVV